jgi:protein-serine/threonine kinase
MDPQSSPQTSGPPIQPPPRTSSNQQSTSNPTSPQVPTDRVSSSRDSKNSFGDGQAPGPEADTSQRSTQRDGERMHDDTATAAAAAARSRRRNHQTSSAYDENQNSGQSSSMASPSTSKENSAIPREGSAVLNRMVVTDPEVDIAREQSRVAEAQPVTPGPNVDPVTGLAMKENDIGSSTGAKSRQDHSASARRKDTKFGDYILGQTLGEGEFGKVKMGWKKDGGGVQVAIKLIRKESLGTNPSRLPKIYREIAILRELSHPNIVRLHEMVETERHIGIILEYASGGELFDFILNNRYLKDNSARRLFAQLVSGVGYLHKKGIVHRDLKLENLLLDRNRNIIITDFGFANTFDPGDELGDEIEKNLASRDYVRRRQLDKVMDSGHRRGDLMQTSCGSPCYAAPELVVSDSLYTGRKVDVWSCGVILVCKTRLPSIPTNLLQYAMLAGYLPFDDDPANPEGDNINLLYKYIVSTPLTFPEYVTPHARDLLRRILVPDPRKRADLFEVARHSWLSDYAHVVSFITSGTTSTSDIANTTVTDDRQDGPLLARSASVREPSKSQQPHTPVIGGLVQKHGQIDPEAQANQQKTSRDAKRRTVQLEYVPPQSQTMRGELSPIDDGSTPKSRARSGSQGAIDVPRSAGRATSTTKPLPQNPPAPQDSRRRQNYQQAGSGRSPRQTDPQQNPGRSGRDGARAVSDSTGAFATTSRTTRPKTGGSTASNDGRTGSSRLPPSRGSYSRPLQPSAPTVATTNAQGKLAQPKNGKQYVISAPILQPQSALEEGAINRPNTSTFPPRYSTRPRPVSQSYTTKSHKRSNTVGNISEKIFGRTGSIFGGRSDKTKQETPQKSYPPTRMPAAFDANGRRPSTDSRRSSSFGFGRKNSNLGSEKPRRFSLLPASFSLKNFGGSGQREGMPPGTATSNYQDAAPEADSFDDVGRPSAQYVRGQSRSTSGATKESVPLGYDGTYDSKPGTPILPGSRGELPPVPQARIPRFINQDHPGSHGSVNAQQYSKYGKTSYPIESEPSLGTPTQQSRPNYPPGFDSYEDVPRPSRSGHGPNVLQKNNRKFTDAYEQDQQGNYTAGAQNSGSSGAARKVMDFFRRRGKARAGDDR